MASALSGRSGAMTVGITSIPDLGPASYRLSGAGALVLLRGFRSQAMSESRATGPILSGQQLIGTGGLAAIALQTPQKASSKSRRLEVKRNSLTLCYGRR